MKAYDFHFLSDKLIYVVWNRIPTPQEEMAFLEEHQAQLDSATTPLYYLSDLRRGKIINMRVLNQMSQLTKHENYGAGTAFSSDPLGRLMVNSFRSLSTVAKDKTAVFNTPEEALSFLERKHEGLTQAIDWDTVITS